MDNSSSGGMKTPFPFMNQIFTEAIGTRGRRIQGYVYHVWVPDLRSTRDRAEAERWLRDCIIETEAEAA